MKRYLSLLGLASALFITACTPKEISDVLNQTIGGGLSTEEVGLGLKEALNRGIAIGSEKLSLADGYFKSPYKILLPPEARKVTDKLSNVPGFKELEGVMEKKLNRAAELAAKEAKPIFTSAIRQMTIEDAWNILKGQDNAATQYLTSKTRQELYTKFQPIIFNALEEVDAVKVWGDAVKVYNNFPLTQKKANPRLDDYVADKALDGLFDMVAKEEKLIRTDVSHRVTDLLKRVFAEQD